MTAVSGDSGSAPVEFVLVSSLLMALVLAIVQVGFAVHVRTVLTAAAADGARHGARSGATAEDAEERTRSLVATALTDSYAEEIRARRVDQDGVPTVEVEVRADLPVLGLWGPADVLRVRAHALAE